MNLQKIYLVRHAETVLDGHYCGAMDVCLSKHGDVQARKLGAYFESIPIDICFASPLLRTRQTAAHICTGKKLEPQFLDSIREIDFGEWEGKKFDEVQRRDPAIYKQWLENPFETKIPKGEPFNEFSKRVGAFALQIKKNRFSDILVVSHGGALSMLLIHLLDMKSGEFWNWAPSLASITELRRSFNGTASAYQLVRFKDTSHLSHDK